MNLPRYAIGMDGGGTKTAAELCDLEGNVLASASGGPTNFQVIGVEPAARTILDLVETCCHSIGCPVERIGSVVAGLTGAGRPGDKQRMVEGIALEAGRRGQKLQSVIVDSDARIALEGAFGGGPGIIVIAGTGSIVFGKDRAGGIQRAGGWGRIIGDEGSGYAMGRELFRAVAAAFDGRGPSTTLSALLKKTTGFDGQEAIVTALYKNAFDVASVAPLVLQAAEKGDRVARRIVTTAAHDLLPVIASVVHKLRGARATSVAISFVGGLLTSKNFYSDRLRALLRRSVQRVRIQEPEAPPVHGAVLMALQPLLTRH